MISKMLTQAGGSSRSLKSLRRTALVTLVAVAGTLGGCADTDGWLWDESKLGRWEYTPTRVPILSRIAAIEDVDQEAIVYSEPTEDDLIPEIRAYRIGPGDTLDLLVYDLFIENQPEPFRRTVDLNGYIEIPQLGQINVGGKTIDEAKEEFYVPMRELISSQPVVDISVTGRSQLRYHVVGAVARPGTYFIPNPDFRLLQALAAPEGFSEEADFIYVIRQIPLTEAAAGRGIGETPNRPTQENGKSAIDTIEDLLKQQETQPSGSPGLLQPENPPAQPAEPPIDLIDPSKQPEALPPGTLPGTGETRWVYINNQWRLVKSVAAAPEPGQAGAGATKRKEQLVTQRVIRIPMSKLVGGISSYNIVIRQDDIIRVPPPPQGFVYVGGEVARGGAFNLANRLTLTRLIDSAGGLSAIAVPDRVDLVRMLGQDKQAIVRVNLRAISEGTQPDFYLKPNDRINVGTNFWATPLAIIRGGFRTTYGWGFLLDRNFANDVFGNE